MQFYLHKKKELHIEIAKETPLHYDVYVRSKKKLTKENVR